MIRKLHGTLESLHESAALVALPSGVTYEVLLPVYAAGRLGASIDRPVTLHTFHYLEGSSQGSNMTPRLAGFLGEHDRAFFELFTTVKGIGPRKALRAMAVSTARIAAAIADRDVKTLQSLPEIGRRSAETIVASLHGKVDRFLGAGEGRAAGAAAAASMSENGSPGEGEPAPAPGPSAARDALEVLVQLGENRAQAIRWIDDLLTRRPELQDSERLIAEALRLKMTS